MSVLVKIIVTLKENNPGGCTECADGRVRSSLPGKDGRKYRAEDILFNVHGFVMLTSVGGGGTGMGTATPRGANA